MKETLIGGERNMRRRKMFIQRDENRFRFVEVMYFRTLKTDRLLRKRTVEYGIIRWTTMMRCATIRRIKRWTLMTWLATERRITVWTMMEWMYFTEWGITWWPTWSDDRRAVLSWWRSRRKTKRQRWTFAQTCNVLTYIIFSYFMIVTVWNVRSQGLTC